MKSTTRPLWPTAQIERRIGRCSVRDHGYVIAIIWDRWICNGRCKLTDREIACWRYETVTVIVANSMMTSCSDFWQREMCPIRYDRRV